MQYPGSSVRRSDRLFLVVLFLLSGYFSYLHWLKMPSFWGDSARWLFETYRVFQGDTPYRDVSSLYPPLSLYIFAFAYKLFGQTFATAQVLVDILSVALLLSTYALGRLFMTAGLSAAVVLCLTLAGASSDSSFSLFGLSVYTPSVLIASLGLNLFLIALVKGLRGGALRLPHILLATVGCTLSVLSRIEFAPATALCMGLVLVYLWNRQSASSALKLLGVGLIVISPSLIVFGYLIGIAGLNSVVEGVAVYRSSSMVCPYWPTGLGLLGFLAGLCEGVLLYCLGALLSEETGGKRRHWLLGTAIAALLVTGTYLYAAWPDFPRYWALPAFEPFSRGQTLAAAVSLTHLLVASMSVAAVLTLTTLWRVARALVRKQSLREAVIDENILYAAGAALGIRSLFGTLWTEIPGVSPAAYTILFLIGGVLLSKAFRQGESAHTWRGMIRTSIPACLFLTYGIGRLFWYNHVESGAAYYPLQTIAGGVLLKTKASVDVYNYVTSNAGPNDFVADVAYGGGINFAARRRSPLFMTMFSFVMPSERYLMLDADRIKRLSPALVIGQDYTHLGTRYGAGTTNGCMFPRLVWRSTRISGDVEKPLPAIAFVEANYTPVLKTEGIVVLAPGRGVGTGR